MKLKKGLDHGLNGFHVATIPKAPRSNRRRAAVQHMKTDEDDGICPFELLASLARKLLQESESSSASSKASGKDHTATAKDAIKDGCQFEDKPLKRECLELGSSEVSAVVSQSASQNCDYKHSLNEFPLPKDDDILEHTSKVIDSGFSGKVGGNAIYKSNFINASLPSKVEGGSPNFRESFYDGMENVFEQQLETKGMEKGGLNGAETICSRDPTELRMTFPLLIKSDRDVKLPPCRNSVPNSLFSRHRNAYNKLAVRDYDDNLSRTNKVSNKLKVYRPVTRIGDRRIRKLRTSKYWKVAPKWKDLEFSRADGGVKPLYRKRKAYNHERCQNDAFRKRRKFHDRNSVDTFDGGFSSESVTNSPEKGRNGDKRCISSISHGASGVTSSVAVRQASLHSKDSNVKFSIKSFKVPEIFVEVSETATISSLKRTVMDAVTAILGGGLHVGILLHGKKIRDDNRTLSQTGISSEDSLDTLGFTLEPSTVQVPPSLCSAEDPPLLLPCVIPQPAPRSPVTPTLDSAIHDALPDPPPTSEDNHVERNHEALIPHTDLLTDMTLPDSRAIVAVPPIKVESLAVVPVNQKIRRTDIAQRRTRRPFSVLEVEALVQAVEELGTGRWRDVKLQSFENADHRTYVDLKDKWKTLVHTARISPQQRRGEPVPQVLLDRVLAAHAYWSQHQEKQQGKHQPGILKIEA